MDVRIVASYTTLPSRYNVLKESIQSMTNQTHKLDAIYLTLPYKAARLNKEYPPLPDDINQLCTVIRTDIDYGPITKVYGALISETDPNTIIISCDDDVLFAPNYIEIMINHHKSHPNSCICGTGALIGRGLFFLSIVSTVKPFDDWKGFTGFEVPIEGRKVDLIFGVAGVLYTRGMFPSNDELNQTLFQHCLNDDAVFHNDDVLISGYLSKQGIERRIFLDIPSITHINGEDALSGDIFKMIFRLNTSIEKVKSLGYYTTMEESSLAETPAMRVIFTTTVIILFLIILLTYYYIK